MIWRMGQCPACFEPLRPGGKCGCGYDPAIPVSGLLLPPGSSLLSYRIGLVLGSGGFGVTYLGWDTKTRARVAIKEYLPRDHAGRSGDSPLVHPHTTDNVGLFRKGLERFLQEAELLSKFDHPNIVGVSDFFEENGTAYLVMPYYPSKTLAKHVAEEGPMDAGQAVRVMLGVLDGLRHVHERKVDGRRWIHRDVKPANILLRSEGSPLLIDFGAARAEVGEQSQTMTVILTPGFAPYEQYFQRGKTQGPWVDVYGAAATLYFVLTGQPPPTAVERHEAEVRGRVDPLILPERFAPDVSPRISEVISMGLAIDYRRRPQNANQYLSLLNRAAATPSKPRPRRRWLIWVAPPALAALAGAALLHGRLGSSCSDATSRWAAIEASTRAADYEAFLRDFSRCEEATRARQRHDEVVAWDGLDKASPSDLRLFLERYPDGLLAEEASRLAHDVALKLAAAAQAKAAQAMTSIPLERMTTRTYREASRAFARGQGLLETGHLEEAAREFSEACEQFERLRGS
jgi:serine/threonine protein kinase